LEPRQIARQLRIPVDLVYRTVATFKSQVKSLTPERILNPARPKVRQTCTNNPALLDAIQAYIEAHGIYDLKVRELGSHLRHWALQQPV
jgi:hypothetical protein